DDEGNVDHVTSAATAVVANVNDAPTGSVWISGTSTLGMVLAANRNIADADGLTGLGRDPLTYAWQQSGNEGATWLDVAGATAARLTLQQAQVGKLVRVVATYTDDGGTIEHIASGTTALVRIGDQPPLSAQLDNMVAAMAGTPPPPAGQA